MVNALRLLLALLVAAGLVVGGWAGLHALGMGSPTLAAGGPGDPVPDPEPVPGPPRPLPPRPVDRGLADASTPRNGRALAVQVGRGDPAGELVVGVFDGDGAMLDWHTLPAGEGTADLRFDELPAAALHLRVAASALDLRRHYLAAAAVDAGAAEAALDVDSRVLGVLVTAPDHTPVRGALVQVRRSGDDGWRLPGTPPWTGADGRARVRLGPGAYRIEAALPGGDGDVPVFDPVELTIGADAAPTVTLHGRRPR